MPYFLIVYDQTSGELLELTPYEAWERDDALAARFAREVVERDRPHIEVVLLGAASEEALRLTHARYFRTAAEIAATGYGSAPPRRLGGRVHPRRAPAAPARRRSGGPEIPD